MPFARHLPFCIFLIFNLTNQALAQRSGRLGSYHNLVLEIPIAGKWSIYSDNELRSIGFFERFFHYEIKAGIKYKINRALAVTAAVGIYETYGEGPEYEFQTEKTEFRLWQQIVSKHELLCIEIENRLRIEEVMNRDVDLHLRYRPQLKLPLNMRSLKPGAIYLAAFDELFIQFQHPAIKRNRLFVGGGFVFSNSLAMQTGLLRQVDYHPEKEDRTKNFFYLQLKIRL